MGDGDDGDDGSGVVRASDLGAAGIAENPRADADGPEVVARDEDGDDDAVARHVDGAGARSGAGPASPVAEAVAAVRRGRDRDVGPAVVPAPTRDRPPGGWRRPRGERVDGSDDEVGRDGDVVRHGEGAGAGARAAAQVARPLEEAVAEVGRRRHRDGRPGVVRTPGGDRPPGGRRDARRERVAGDEVRRDGAGGGHAHRAGSRARAGPRPALEAVAVVRRGRHRDVRAVVVHAPAGDRAPGGRVRARGEGVARDEVGRDGAGGGHRDLTVARARAVPDQRSKR